MKQGKCAVWFILLAASVVGGWLGSAVGMAYAGPQTSTEAEEEAKYLIVMIKGRFGDGPTTGAGIVFGAGNNRLYIATANHVVRRGINRAEDVRVKFRFLPGEWIEARLLDDVDRQLDLAVLSVVGLDRHAIPVDTLPFKRLGDARALERGDSVHHVGYPMGVAWRVSVTPDKVSNRIRDLIRFESSTIGQGSSGGGLFNEQWELVGMIRADQPPDGIAVSVQSILDALSSWGYPVNLTHLRGEPPPPPSAVSVAEKDDTRQDPETLRRSAEGGDPRAQYNLSFAYVYGRGVEQNWGEAVKWLRRSADQGYADAQSELGAWYAEGHGVGLDYDEALKWTRKAVNQGHATAMLNMAALYINAQGVDKDDSEAAKWLRKAGELGDETAQFGLAKMLTAGQGVKKDYAEAAKWYRKAAVQGHVEAQAQLGAFYALGVGVEQDNAEAVKWLTKAAAKNEPSAQYNLGGLYHIGQGVPQDDVEAIKWYRKAAYQHEVNAQAMLGASYALGQGVEQDYEQALTWLRKAAEKGQSEAQYNLGIMYAKGEGLESDIVEALKWFRKAAAGGHEKAKEKLRELGIE